MKKLSISALAMVAALVAASAAHADTAPGWYVGAGVGASLPMDPTIHEGNGRSTGGRMEDVNVDALGDAGYAWNNGLHLEGEYFHDQNNMNRIGSYNSAGHLSNNAAFANVLYDFQTGTRYTPYIGAGAGPDWVNVSNVGRGSVGYLRGETLVAGYQGIAGVSAQLDPNWAVTADYRYIASFDPKVGSTTGGEGRISNASNNVIVGLRYNFDAPAPVAAPAHPMAPAVAQHGSTKAMYANGQANFTVFFDFDKSTLTPEAKKIIASAAKEYKTNGYAAISVTGHTDTSGTPAYNEKLSVRRAKAVEAELKKLGVAGTNISEKGVGEDGLLVPTADGVREAQNRRAEIVLSK
jgi:outer membrane protein OmpA-like peptidoglycan-associated protein